MVAKAKGKNEGRGAPKVVKVKLYPDVAAKIEAARKEAGYTHLEFFERLLQTFSEFDAVMQAHLLRRYPREIEPDVARMLLNKIARRETETGATREQYGGK